MARRNAHTGHPPRRPRSSSSTPMQTMLSPGIALAYIYQVRVEFDGQPHVYNTFLDMLRAFKSGRMATEDVTHALATLFRGHKDLLMGFNTFLPSGFSIRVNEDGQTVLHSPFDQQQQPQSPQNDIHACACCGEAIDSVERTR